MMIGYIEGKILKKEPDRFLVLANQIGYDIRVPLFVVQGLTETAIGDSVSLFIHYHQTERQPVPVLIGFKTEMEKEFFQHFISVEAIGPLKAVKALTAPIEQIAGAIEKGDTRFLSQLKGIGARTAQKIVATLGGKMDRFTGSPVSTVQRKPVTATLANAVTTVLVEQLGYKMSEAEALIAAALKRNPDANTPEALFDEIVNRR